MKALKDSFKIFKESFLNTFKYLLKKPMNYLKYYTFVFVQLFASLFVILLPFSVKAHYSVTEKVIRNENFELVDEYKGITSLKKFFSYFLLNGAQLALILGVLVATLVIASPLILIAMGIDAILVSIVLVACLLFVVILMMVYLYSVNYYYAKKDLSVVDTMKKSISLGKENEGLIIITNLICSVISSLIMMIPLMLIIFGLEEVSYVLIGIGVLLLVFILPIFDLLFKNLSVRLIRRCEERAVCKNEK